MVDKFFKLLIDIKISFAIPICMLLLRLCCRVGEKKKEGEKALIQANDSTYVSDTPYMQLQHVVHTCITYCLLDPNHHRFVTVVVLDLMVALTLSE